MTANQSEQDLRGVSVKRVLLALGLVWPMAGTAEILTFFHGDKLLQECQSQSVAPYNLCIGYLVGLLDAIHLRQHEGKMDPTICAPEGITAAELRRVFVDHAKREPGDLPLAASELGIAAFSQAWPCPPAPQPQAHLGVIQLLLAELGYEPGRVDGVMGPRTEAAIRAFQRDRNIPEDGKATREFCDFVYAVWENRGPPGPPQ